MPRFTEFTVEDVTLTWLQAIGWAVARWPEVAPGELFAERSDYSQAIVEQRLRNALTRLNPDLPAEALNDAYRKLTRPEGPTLEAQNRAFHRMLVEGVTVEYRAGDGAIRGAQVWPVDVEAPDNNDWLATHQFTGVGNSHERWPEVVMFVNDVPLGVLDTCRPLSMNTPAGEP